MTQKNSVHFVTKIQVSKQNYNNKMKSILYRKNKDKTVDVNRYCVNNFVLIGFRSMMSLGLYKFLDQAHRYFYS